jgi:pimeloyl-ACP methyl ester carboxylesterase
VAKKNTNGDGSRPRKRPDGRYEAPYWVETTTGRKRRSVDGNTNKECAQKLLDAMAAKGDEPVFVAAVMEESGYADLPLLLRDRLPESSGLPSFFNPGIFLMAKLFLDLDPWAVRPEEDAAKLSEEGMPLLIINSTDDEVVPFEHAEMLAASYPDAEFWKVEGYGHVEAYSHPEYRQRLLNFLQRTVVEEEM